MSSRTLIFSIVCSLLIWEGGGEADDFFKQDQSKWVDPTDGLNYISKSKWGKSQSDNDQDIDNSLTPYNTNMDELQKTKELKSNEVHCDKTELLLMKQYIENCENPSENQPWSKYTNSDEAVFLKRHVTHLLKLLSYSRNSELQHYLLQIQLTNEDRQNLDNFLNDKGDIQTVDDVLFNLFENAFPASDGGIPLSFLETSIMFQTAGIILSVAGTFYLLLKLPMFRILLLLFVTSSLWHWMCMYKTALAKRNAELMKFSGDLPIQCNPKLMGWFDTIKLMFSSGEDDCVQYHKLVIVDPFWEVSPLLAVADAGASFVFHPLERFGEKLGLFFAGLYRYSPTFTFWIIAPVAVIFLFFLATLMFGYQIHTPFISFKHAVASPSQEQRQIQQPGRELIENIPVKNYEAKNASADEEISVEESKEKNSVKDTAENKHEEKT